MATPARIGIGKSNAAILADPNADLTEWDDEELERGRRRDKNGNFSGRPPSVIPRAVFVEFMARRTQRAEIRLASSLEELAAGLTNIATDKSVDPELRLKAMTWVLEHFYGKAPASVDVRADVRHRMAPWEQVLQGAIVTVGTEDVVDAEVVEEDDYDPEVNWDDE